MLLHILETNPGKTLVYAGTYTNIKKLSTLLLTALKPTKRKLLQSFGAWLAENYDANWELTKLVTRGVGVHNGQLHRSLSQIQIRLFEENGGIDTLVSTSSIIEGVNTSAQNVVLWSNRNGQAKINDFTYKNIIGRSGRMFRHFIGKVFVLEEPPPEAPTQLALEMPEELLGTLDDDAVQYEYSSDQLDAIHAYEGEMRRLVGRENFDYFRRPDSFQSSNGELILRIAQSIRTEPTKWNGLRYLNSSNPSTWDRHLYNIIQLNPGAWETKWSKYVEFVKILVNNWRKSIPELLEELSIHDIGLDEFFKLERNTTFKLASLLGDVCTVYNRLNPDQQIDLSPALSRISHAFLPPVVFQLEEYGVPRMISRKIHKSRIINLASQDKDIHETLDDFLAVGFEDLVKGMGDLDEFDTYILRYFYDGIRTEEENLTKQ